MNCMGDFLISMYYLVFTFLFNVSNFPLEKNISSCPFRFPPAQKLSTVPYIFHSDRTSHAGLFFYETFINTLSSMHLF
jgi:hypothetical protein